MKKFVSLFLVFSILALSGNLFAKKKGADLIIQKTVGYPVKGELIAVKENSLLLLDRDSGADVTVDVGDINVITHVRKSKLFQGAGMGLLFGGGIGAAGGFLTVIFSEYDDFFIQFPLFGGEKEKSIFETAIIFGAIMGGIGALIGGIAGAAAGTDKTIQIEGKSDSEIQEILKKLRKKARIRNSK